MDVALLERTLTESGEPSYRARQVWEWTTRGVSSYDEMTTLPKALRVQLSEAVPFSTLDLVTERESSDGTVKALFRTYDGHSVEASSCATGMGAAPCASRPSPAAR
jgi:23S rRNA (adenine2503-C2)-methyltransferase